MPRPDGALRELSDDRTIRAPGRWGTARPGRRDVLRGIAAVGAFLAADVAALLIANNSDRSVPVDAAGFPRRFRQGIRSTSGLPQESRQGGGRCRLVRQQRQRSRVVERGGVRARRTPVLGRFSLAGGNPHIADTPSAVRGLGLAFGFPGGQQWRMATLNIPVFLDNSPQSFYERLIASAVVAALASPIRRRWRCSSPPIRKQCAP